MTGTPVIVFTCLLGLQSSDTSVVRPIQRLKHGLGITALAISPNGKVLASAALLPEGGKGAASVVLRNFPSCTEIATYTFDHAVSCLSFSDDASLLAVTTFNGCLELWDVRKSARLSITTPEDKPLCATFLPLYDILLTSGGVEPPRFWFVDITGKLQPCFRQPLLKMPAATTVAISGANKFAISTGFLNMENDVLICNHTGELLQRLKGLNNVIGHMCFSRDLKLLGIGGVNSGAKNNTAIIFGFTDNDNTNRVVIPHTSGVCSMVFTEDASRLLIGDNIGNIAVWDVKTKLRVGIVAAHTAQVNQLLVSPSGKHVVSGSHDGEILIWNSSSFALLKGK